MKEVGSDDLLLLCSDIIKIVVNCLFLRVLNCLSTLRYQIKVGLDTKFSKFCLKLLREIFTDICWNDLKLLHGIYDSTHNLGKNFYFAQLHGICGISRK